MGVTTLPKLAAVKQAIGAKYAIAPLRLATNTKSTSRTKQPKLAIRTKSTTAVGLRHAPFGGKAKGGGEGGPCISGYLYSQPAGVYKRRPHAHSSSVSASAGEDRGADPGSVPVLPQSLPLP